MESKQISPEEIKIKTRFLYLEVDSIEEGLDKLHDVLKDICNRER